MSVYVDVKNLVKMYGDFCAVDNLCLTVEQGEIYGLLGPNGAGKSTTLSIITTLNKCTRGKVTIGGYDIVKDERKVKRLVGMVPQDIAVYRHLNAYENVKFFASFYGIRGRELDETVNEALDFVGLRDRKDMKPGKMSGGMQRRLNIACGIAHRPKLIIMDEPTVGVDAQSRENILESIRILKDRGATVIYTSHYMQEVEEICDNIAIMDNGKLIAKGTKEELVSLVTDVKSISITTRQGNETAFEAIMNSIKVLPDVINVSRENNVFRIGLSIRNDNIFPILDAFISKGVVVSDITSNVANLDMTFLGLTGRELR